MSSENALLQQLVNRYPDLAGCAHTLKRAYHILESAFSNGKKLMICGNGGSAADAEHIAAELMKGLLKRRPIDSALGHRLQSDTMGKEMSDKLQLGLPTIALTTHQALITAFSNDVDPSLIFAQQVLVYGQPGDVLLAISTSGHSPSILKAAYLGSKTGLKIIGLTGKNGDKLAGYCDVTIKVPGSTTSEIQELHLPVYHTLCMMLEEHFFEE